MQHRLKAVAEYRCLISKASNSADQAYRHDYHEVSSNHQVTIAILRQAFTAHLQTQPKQFRIVDFRLFDKWLSPMLLLVLEMQHLPVLTYATEKGLCVTSQCRNPLPKNIFSHFCPQAHRIKLKSQTFLDKATTTFAAVYYHPLIIGMETFDSFVGCRKVIYNGPLASELANDVGIGHAMVVVGICIVVIDGEVKKFVILQNSWGVSFGFRGYVLVPVELGDGFTLLELESKPRKRMPKICDLCKNTLEPVMSMIKNTELCGQAMIAYLQQKGFPQVALYFGKDERTRFNLALECGNIEKALESAKKIDEKDHWYRLGVEALGQGNAGIIEYEYQKTKSFERLSFHYLITGNLEKLSKMMRIAEVKNDVMGQFHDALYLGDIRERVKILENAGHLPLAYVTATVHALDDIAERIAVEFGDNIPHLPKARKPAGDWPSLMVSKGIFEVDLGDTARGGNHHDYEDAADADWVRVWTSMRWTRYIMETLVCWRMRIEHEENEEGGWDLEDLDLPPDADTPKTTSNSRSSVFVGPTPGMLLLNMLLLGISTQQSA
ncbi:coatomer subunit alpha-1-like [Henckelia pumila]|uniref:coatomer subunit alpha-1-like n=1 Tax=Henckelia pumila TaxID=405737 RepID=UPI003C6E981D